MKTGRGQTIIDMAMQTCGSAEASWAIATVNGVGLTEDAEGLDLATGTAERDEETALSMATAGAKPASDGEPERSERNPIGQTIIGEGKIA